MGRKKKVNEEPKYIISEVLYGDKRLVDCMKNVIRHKLNESEENENK